MTSYWFAAIFSLLLHGVALWLVFQGWQQPVRENLIKPPTYIKATLIELQSQSKASAPVQKSESKPRQSHQNKKRQEQERLKKLAQEKARQEQVAKQRLQEQRRREEQERSKQEALKRQAEQERLAMEKQRFEENIAQELTRLEAERKAEQLAQQAIKDEELAQSYSALIRKRIEQNWSRPLSAREDLETILRIQMIPTGEVINVTISKSSGNKIFDNSAIRAVKKVGQFDELRGMPTRIFENNFRQFQLKFKPQDESVNSSL